MTPRSAIEFLLLAAVWGGSYLAMQFSVREFGVFGMAFTRVAAAAAVLLPLLVLRAQVHLLRRHLGPVLLLGILNSALPFSFNSWSLLHITTGLSSIVNATMPLFGALVAWLWLGERLTGSRVLGLAIGFGGVAWLSWHGLQGGAGPLAGWAILAGLASALSYGASSSLARRYLADVPPTAVAAGSQLGAMAGLCLPAALHLPATMPGPVAWAAVLTGGVVCSALGYLLFFRLVERVGPSVPLTVTFLVPVFAMFYGAVLADEQITLAMVLAGGVILAGVALASGVLHIGARSAAAPLPRVPG